MIRVALGDIDYYEWPTVCCTSVSHTLLHIDTCRCPGARVDVLRSCIRHLPYCMLQRHVVLHQYYMPVLASTTSVLHQYYISTTRVLHQVLCQYHTSTTPAKFGHGFRPNGRFRVLYNVCMCTSNARNGTSTSTVVPASLRRA